jgi:hypothetical protein
MMRHFINAVALVITLFGVGCSVPAHKPAYDGWSLLV